MKAPRTIAAWIAVGLATCATVQARTIVMDATSCDRMAAIAKPAPRMSWAARTSGDDIYNTGQIDLTDERALLLRFPLDQIPAGNRIAHAELVVTVAAFSGVDPRFYVWRLLADWGHGVCYDYRTTLPKETPWTKPGARGLSSDRATRPTDIVRPTEIGEVVINVTEDVELWYTDQAPNNGWILTVEDPGVTMNLTSPTWTGAPGWRLRITYEPAPE